MKFMKQTGFTLIELVIVIVILGILGAIAVPKYIDLQTEARTAAQQATLGAVKSAWAIAIAENKDFPTVTGLATYVHAQSVATVVSGVTLYIGTSQYRVNTFDSDCTTATTALTSDVECISGINAL